MSAKSKESCCTVDTTPRCADLLCGVWGCLYIELSRPARTAAQPKPMSQGSRDRILSRHHSPRRRSSFGNFLHLSVRLLLFVFCV